MIYPRENPKSLGLPDGKLQHKLYFDTMDDFPNLPRLDRAAPGSDAYCVATGDVYILSGKSGAWEVQ